MNFPQRPKRNGTIVGIEQELVPVHEPVFRTIKAVRQGEKKVLAQDGYIGVGWRIALLTNSGEYEPDEQQIPIREKRGQQRKSITKKLFKAQKSTFARMIDRTEKIIEKSGLEWKNVAGDFATPATQVSEDFDPCVINGGTILPEDWFVLGSLTDAMIRRHMKTIGVRVNPRRELVDGRLHIVGVDIGAHLPTGDRSFTDYANEILPAYSALRTDGRSCTEASALAISAAFETDIDQLYSAYVL